MKLKNRIISFLILCTMIFSSSLAAVSFAAPDPESGASDEYAGSFFKKMIGLELLDDNDIVTGSNMTRGDFVRLAMKISGLESASQGTPDAFADLESTSISTPYINTAAALGYLSGSGGDFYPNRTITYTEAIKIMMEILGYGVIAEAGGGYPAGYASCASLSGLLSELGTVESGELSLESGLRILDAALGATITEVFYENDYVNTYISGQTLSDYLKIGEVEGIVSECGATGLYSANMHDEEMICIGNVYMKIADPRSYDDLLGLNCRAFWREDKSSKVRTLGHIEPIAEENKVLELKADDFEYDGSEYVYDLDEKERTAKLDPQFSFIYNGQFAGASDELMDTDNGYLRLIDNNTDGRYDVVFVYSFKNYFVTDVNPHTNDIAVNDGTILSLEEDDENYVTVRIDGEEKPVNLISAGSVISYAESLLGNKRVKILEASSKSVSGTVEAKGDKVIEVSGTEYDAYEDVLAGITPGQSGTFYFDYSGKLAWFEAGKSYQYGYLMDFGTGSKGLDPTYIVKIYTAAGKFEEFVLADELKLNGAKKTPDSAVASSVEPNQLIRYALNSDGKINLIETAVDAPVFTDEGDSARTNDTFRLSSSGTGQKFYTANWAFNFTAVVEANTKVFFIPTTGIEDDFRVTTRAYLTNDSNYNYKAYNADEYGVAEIVVCTLNYRYGGRFLYIVDTVTKTIDSDGNEREALRCYSNMGVLTTFIADERVNLSSMGFEEGDIARVITNSAGNIVTAEKYKSDEDFMSGSGITSDGVMSGTVKAFDAINKRLIVETDGRYYILYVSATTAGVYDEGEWSTLSVGEISAGDRVILSHNRPTVSYITIIR